MNEADSSKPEPQTEPDEMLADASREERTRDAAEHAEKAARAQDDAGEDDA